MCVCYLTTRLVRILLKKNFDIPPLKFSFFFQSSNFGKNNMHSNHVLIHSHNKSIILLFSVACIKHSLETGLHSLHRCVLKYFVNLSLQKRINVFGGVLNVCWRIKIAIAKIWSIFFKHQKNWTYLQNSKQCLVIYVAGYVCHIFKRIKQRLLKRKLIDNCWLQKVHCNILW